MGDLKKKKVIWLVNKHAAPLEYNATNLRTYKLACYLQEFGYDVRIIASSYVHNRNIELINNHKGVQEKDYDGVKFIHVKTTSYKRNGLKRIYSLFQFGWKVFLGREKWEKPDVIIHTSNIPFDIFVLWCAKKMRALYVTEVVDLWPESFVAFGLLKASNPIMKVFYSLEYYFYKQADRIVFSMEGGKDYIREKKWNIENGGKIDLNKVYYLNNGVDIKDFEYNLKYYCWDDEDLKRNDVKKVIYLGSIRLVNNLMALIDAAACLKDDSNILFLIYGDGEERERLEKYCIDNRIYNVKFKQRWIDPKYVPYVLHQSTINIVNYKVNSVERFGGSQNKLFQALASGRPICSNVGMGYSIIKYYNVGVDECFNSSVEYSLAIKKLVSLDEKEYNAMCERAIMAAQDFDLNKLAEKYLKILN